MVFEKLTNTGAKLHGLAIQLFYVVLNVYDLTTLLRLANIVNVTAEHSTTGVLLLVH